MGIIRSGMATTTAERKSTDDDGALRDDDRDENDAPHSKSGLSNSLQAFSAENQWLPVVGPWTDLGGHTRAPLVLAQQQPAAPES